MWEKNCKLQDKAHFVDSFSARLHNTDAAALPFWHTFVCGVKTALQSGRRFCVVPTSIIYTNIFTGNFFLTFFFALVCMLSFLLALVFHFHPSHRTCAALSTVCQIEKSNQFLPHLALSLLLFAASSVFYFCFWSFAFNLTRRYCCFGPCTSLFCRYWLWVHLRFEN